MDRKPEVLAFIKAHGEVSLGAVAEHLGVTKQGALRHLEALREAGLVELGESEHRGPGRPEHRYHLTPEASESFPQAHRELAGELIEFLESDQLERFFAERAKRMESEYAERLAGLGFEDRVRELARLAAEHGHMTEIEEEDGLMRLRHRNCPIQDIAGRTPHPCQYEREMYERLLGAAVQRSEWLGGGDMSCAYDVTARSGPRARHTSTQKGEVNG
jgi:DeoR family transcriptional regulator, suf operon transcriptional repressor